MKTLHARCAGLDVHKDTVMACVRVVARRSVREEVRTFATSTSSLLALRDWLKESGCTHVAMEATGVYWKPVWHVLEDDFELVLANASHIKAVPGRKSDVADATWIAGLLAHGLIRGSFVPERPIQELRDLTRARKQFVRERGRHVQRVQKVLEDANIKLASVISDVTGASGRRILDAMLAGESDPAVLASLRDKGIKASHEAIVEALRGKVTDHHRFLLRAYLREVDATDAAIASFEAQIEVHLRPFREHAERLMTIPGVSETTAHVVLAEIGSDMSRFPTVAHLTSWAGLCPRMDESAGKRRSTALRKGNAWLKTALVQAAWAAIRAKKGRPDTYERALFLRLRARGGAKKAIVAVARALLQASYFILRDGVEYVAPPRDHFDQIDREKNKRRLLEQLHRLGYTVQVTEEAA